LPSALAALIELERLDLECVSLDLWYAVSSRGAFDDLPGIAPTQLWKLCGAWITDTTSSLMDFRIESGRFVRSIMS
jgi:hypothetical protein